MKKRKCDACGTEYQPKSKRSRYCYDPGCKRARNRVRMRKKRAGAEVVELPRNESAPQLPTHGTTYEATLQELQAAHRADSALGQAVLRLAARIDANAADTGSSLATMVRQLRDTLDAVTSTGSREGDPVDELKAKREARQRQSKRGGK